MYDSCNVQGASKEGMDFLLMHVNRLQLWQGNHVLQPRHVARAPTFIQ